MTILARQQRGAWPIHVAVGSWQNWTIRLSVIARLGTDGADNDGHRRSASSTFNKKRYWIGVVYVRFVGTHAEYDKIDVATVEME